MKYEYILLLIAGLTTLSFGLLYIKHEKEIGTFWEKYNREIILFILLLAALFVFLF
jgi:hypothetical protein